MKHYYTRTWEDGRVEKFSIEEYEKIIHPKRILDKFSENLKINGIVVKCEGYCIIAFNTSKVKRHISLYNQYLIYKCIRPISDNIASKIIVSLNHGVLDMYEEDKIEEYLKDNVIIFDENKCYDIGYM